MDANIKTKILRIILFALREFEQHDSKLFNLTLDALERQHTKQIKNFLGC